MITPKNVEQILVYKDPEFAHAVNQVSIIKLQNGELFMGFNEERYPFHADSGQSCFIKSKDGGKTWDPATKKVIWPYTDFMGNWDCAFAQIADGTILMHTRVCSFIAPWGIKPAEGGQSFGGILGNLMRRRLWRQTGYALLKSKDNGDTWTDPIPVNTTPVIAEGSTSETGLGGGYSVGGSGAGHIIELPDGGLIFGLHGRVGSGSTRSFLLRSDDKGDNWEYCATMAYDPAGIISFVEPGITRLKDGKLVCLYRVSRQPGRRDNIWTNYSDDDGSTWSPPKRTNIWGYPSDVLQLQDGRVLAVYGYRRPPWGTRACVSEDGVTWDIKNEFIIKEGGAASPESGLLFMHIGYPTVTQLEDGTIVAAFHDFSDDKKPIQCLRCTRFTL